MPSKKFELLKADKKSRITKALMHEFANHSLASAQIARIVKEAHIARGSFYVYFADLDDAYLYAYGQAMRHLHQPLNFTGSQKPTTADYLSAVKHFLQAVDEQQLRQWMVFHIRINVGLLHAHGHEFDRSVVASRQDDLIWAIQTLVHQSINEALVEPEQQEAIIQRLGKLLHLLEGAS